MRPLKDFPREARAAVRYVLTDIDDTLTNSGRLPAPAYAALEALHEAGIRVIPITGRPAGWCDHIARMWPVDGLVGENGAFYFRYDEAERKMIRRYFKTDEERTEDRHRLDLLAKKILSAVPGAAIASDQAYREADLAVDFCEDVPALPMDDVRTIARIFTESGAEAKISSIHVNGWFGGYDKLSMTRTLLAEVFGEDIDAIREQIVFSGDSPNDCPMFAFFPNAVGVANVRALAQEMEALPAWITDGEGGYGFAELAAALIDARS
ncbi:hypothetical protein GGQ74_000784 [Desulfobaculum xiamenense]|uniref:HAD family hydrolase n=1 Tax=Desulfobaculum xiamenense TaxID=995050 RepID=A0A846QPK3_9BACT|nr:HAD-IIB family hydrolase [Desulfobaculum xiamenense]NJB67144.1 hypothetical protein [Desulfobaculum xiamenense]